MKYITTIGLEIHVQLKTKSKMMCECKNDPEPKKPNVNVCPVCMGHPGTLPRINHQAVDWTIMTGLALGCDIAKESKFDRKNYFYPDLPKGYQISQYDQPFCEGGFVEIKVGDKTKKIKLNRIHLEEDAGKLIHPENADYSLVDYNRASTPLMEIVTEPDIDSPEEARLFLTELKRILRYIGVSNADMEKGQLRCDANISMRPDGQQDLNPKSEIKNMNSFKGVETALTYEQQRQSELLDAGEKLHQATRGWDVNTGTTHEQRTKEGEADYRYFPEPDLPLMTFTDAQIAKIKQALPEMPDERKKRLIKNFGIAEEAAELFIGDRETGEYFENVVSELMAWTQANQEKKEITRDEEKKLTKLASNWIVSRLFALMKEDGKTIADVKITAENFAELVSMIHESKIGSTSGQEVLKIMYDTGGDPSQIIDEHGLAQVSNKDELGQIVDDVIKSNPYSVKDYQSGKEAALKFMIGQVMAATKGKADPKMAGEILVEKLK